MRTGLAIYAVTRPIDPIALSELIPDNEVVTHGLEFARPAPPFPEDALWAIPSSGMLDRRGYSAKVGAPL